MNILEPEKLQINGFGSGRTLDRKQKSNKKKKSVPSMTPHDNSFATTLIQPNGFSLALVNQNDKNELIRVMAADGTQNLVKIKKHNKNHWQAESVPIEHSAECASERKKQFKNSITNLIAS